MSIFRASLQLVLLGMEEASSSSQDKNHFCGWLLRYSPKNQAMQNQHSVQNINNILNKELSPDCLMPTSIKSRVGRFPLRHPCQESFNFCSIKQSWRRKKNEIKLFCLLKNYPGVLLAACHLYTKVSCPWLTIEMPNHGRYTAPRRCLMECMQFENVWKTCEHCWVTPGLCCV